MNTWYTTANGITIVIVGNIINFGVPLTFKLFRHTINCIDALLIGICGTTAISI